MAGISHRSEVIRQLIIGVAPMLVAAVAMVSPTRAKAQAVIEDSFNTGVNGWTLYSDGRSLRWDATAGNPGGCIRGDDSGAGGYGGFVAGPAYDGDRSCLYDGALRWQLYTTHTSAAGPDQPDAALIGGGLTLVCDVPPPPANTWTTRVVTLNEAAGWRKSSLAGAVPTRTEFQNVLRNLTDIRFRAEFSTSIDSARLDNVALASFLLASPESAFVCPGTPVEFGVTFTAGSGNGPFSFQWRKDGTPVDDQLNPSALTPTLVLAGVEVADAGVYTCVVSNPCGSVTTEPALLSVCPGDFNCDGGIDGVDVEAFFSAWAAGDFSADINLDGGIDGADVEYFFARWEGGC